MWRVSYYEVYEGHFFGQNIDESFSNDIVKDPFMHGSIQN